MEDTKKHNNTNFINRKNQESINHRFYISKVDTSNKKINNIISNKNAPKLYKKEVILFQKPKTTTETLFKQSTLEKPKNNIKSSVSEQIKNLELENNELKKKISNKSDIINIVQSKCNEQNKIIYELTKKIQKLKIYIDKNKLKQNAEKLETVRKLIDDFFRYKNIMNNNKTNVNSPKELNFFEHLQDIEEQYLENIAYALEPKFTLDLVPRKEKRYTEIDRKFFGAGKNDGNVMNNNGYIHVNRRSVI